MTFDTYLAYVAACVVLVAVPGPNVTLILANSLRHGMRAGLATVAGTESGIALLLVLLGLGIAPVVAFAAEWFFWLKLVGALYLAYLGLRMLLGEAADTVPAAVRSRSFFLQGFLVMLSNPKVLLFLGAFVPQFLDPAAPLVPQMLLLGTTFFFVALAIDSSYALLASNLKERLTARWQRGLQRAGGATLIGGGLWFVLMKR